MSPTTQVAVIEPQANGKATAECYQCNWITYGPLDAVAHNVLVHIKLEHGLVKEDA